MRLAVGVIMLALVAGCGGSPVAYEEAPGDPVELTVPGDGSALAPASATATPTSTPDADATQEQSTETQAPETQAPETPQETAPEGHRGGGTEAPAGEGESDGTRRTPRPARSSARTIPAPAESALKFPRGLPIHRSTPVPGRQDHCELHRTSGLTKAARSAAWLTKPRPRLPPRHPCRARSRRPRAARRRPGPHAAGSPRTAPAPPRRCSRTMTSAATATCASATARPGPPA